MSLLTETAGDEDGSWSRASEGWPEITEQAHDHYVFANCVDSIPYGSYVLMSKNCLRVHPEHILQLQTDFSNAGKPTASASVARRERLGELSPTGNRLKAPKWTEAACYSGDNVSDGKFLTNISKAKQIRDGLGLANNDEEIELAVQRIVRERMVMMENFITIYLSNTGAKIEDTIMCEQRSADSNTLTYWCEPKGKR